MVEYGCRLPLWADNTDELSETDWFLPPEVLVDLLAWQRTFDRSYDPVSGWPSAQAFGLHCAEGQRLKELLALELTDNEIEFDCWAILVQGEVGPV